MYVCMVVCMHGLTCSDRSWGLSLGEWTLHCRTSQEVALSLTYVCVCVCVCVCACVRVCVCVCVCVYVCVCVEDALT